MARTKDAAEKTVTLAVLGDVCGPPSRRTFALRLWDGTEEEPGHESRFTLVLRWPVALRRMLLPPTDLTLGEAYLRDDFDVEGNLEKATELADVLFARLRSPVLLACLAPAATASGRRCAREGWQQDSGSPEGQAPLPRTR
jgi:hypothetical protein